MRSMVYATYLSPVRRTLFKRVPFGVFRVRVQSDRYTLKLNSPKTFSTELHRNP
jgi:hypothetical protein